MIRMLLTAVVIACSFPPPALASPPSAAQRCEADVELAAGKYTQCRLSAESKYSKNQDTSKRAAALNRCVEKLTSAIAAAADRHGVDNCTEATAGQYGAYLTQCSDDVSAAAVSGGSLPACGDAVVDVVGEDCDGSDLGGHSCTSLGFLGGTLGCSAGCRYETSACARQSFPATGQTTCWNTAGAVISCDGTGQDGDLQRGAALAYIDNGDGTITDPNTNLMWEKPSWGDSSVHERTNGYTWEAAYSIKIAALNADGGFAGFTDWRLPNRRELESIIDLGGARPPVSTACNTGCEDLCLGVTCSCTFPGLYWSSSTDARSPESAWIVNFDVGSVSTINKSFGAYVRAVRGGS